MLPSVVSLAGRLSVMGLSEEPIPMNALSARVSSASPSAMVNVSMLLPNASEPMYVTLAGRASVVRPLSLNAPSLIVASLLFSPKVTETPS